MNVIKENVEKDHQNTLSQLVQIINQEIVMKLKIKEETEFVMKVLIVEPVDIAHQKDNALIFQKEKNYHVQIELQEIVQNN